MKDIMTKSAGWGAKADFKTTDDKVNSMPTNPFCQFEPEYLSHLQIKPKQPTLKLVPLIQQVKIHMADFPIGSAEFELMEKRFKHPKAAMLLQHLEFLNRKFSFPDDGIFRNIYPSKDGLRNKTISEHIGINSRRIVYAILDEIRVHYKFKKGELLIPSEIDFKGKLYATYYLPSHNNRTVYWYRNEELINQLCAELADELEKKKHVKSLKYIVPREPSHELASGDGSELPSEPSYTYKEVELKNKGTEKNKPKNSQKLDTPVVNQKQNTKNPGKAKPKTQNQNQNQTQNNSIEVNTKTVSKLKDTSVVQLGRTIYPHYKHYCQIQDKGILIAEVSSVTDAKLLGKFVQVFSELGFKSDDFPRFFEMLESSHNDAMLYLQERGVWQVKNCKVLVCTNFLANYADRFASWYQNILNEKAEKDAREAESIRIKAMEEAANIELEKKKLSEPKAHCYESFSGYTYNIEFHPPENGQVPESVEYAYVIYKCNQPPSDPCDFSFLYTGYIRRGSVDFAASEARIKSLEALSFDELKQLPFPR